MDAAAENPQGKSVTWADKWQARSAAITTCVVVIAGYVGYQELEQLDRVRTIDTISRITDRWESDRMLRSREQVAAWMDSFPPDSVSSMGRDRQRTFQDVVNFFETLGYMVEGDVIDREHADALISPLAVRYWCEYRPYIQAIRSLERISPRTAEWFEQYAERTMDANDRTC